MNQTTRKTALCGVMSAMALALMYLIHFPIFPAVPFLEYDPADIPIFLCTIISGTPWGIAMTAIVSIVQFLVVSPQSGWTGAFMHFFATGMYVAVCGTAVHFMRKKAKETNIVAVAVSFLLGTLAMTFTMFLLDLIIMPAYMGVPVDTVLGLKWYIIAFNLIKAGANSVIAMLLYIPLKKYMPKFGK